ncbi:MAG TPA: DUF1980 domain-containing protein [Planctomycetota bacterium]|nr:DUF1980 domain-containing protein [Planctomycetota bacterium]
MNPTRLVQSIGWMAFLGVLLLGGGYANYIASWQQWVLIAATAVFGGLVLIDALMNRVSDAHDHKHHDHDHGTATDHWVQTLVHLLPLFLLLTLGVTTLGSQPIVDFGRPAPTSVLSSRHAATDDRAATHETHQAASNPQPAPTQPAQTQPPTIAPAHATPNTPHPTTTPAIETPAAVALLDGPTPPEPPSTAPQAADLAAPTKAAAVPLPLLELYYAKKHPGITRVETIGRLMIPTAEEMAKVPPEINRGDLKLLLYRYVMTCCAADAAPVFVVLRGQDTTGLKIDDWVRVTGTWIPAPALGDMVKLDVDSLTKIEQPAEPFLQAPKK